MSQIRIDKAIEKAIYDFHVTVLDATFGAGEVEVIWDKQIADSKKNQSPPRPKLPFVTLNISTLPFKEGDAEMIYKETDTFSFPMRKAFTVTSNAFAGAEIETKSKGKFGYYNIVEALINGLELESFREILRAGGLAIRGSEDPIDNSALMESVYEFRATVDIFLAYCKIVDDKPGQVDTVQVEGELDTFSTDQIIGEPLV